MGQDQSQVREAFERLDHGMQSPFIAAISDLLFVFLKRLRSFLPLEHCGKLNLNDLTFKSIGNGDQLIRNSPLLLFRFDKDGSGCINFREFTKLLEYIRSKEKEIQRRHLVKKSVVWCPISLDTLNLYEFSRNETTPAITGQRPRDASMDIESEQLYILVEEISRDAGDYFEKIIQKPEGRRQFSSWFFRLVDFDHDKKLEVKEILVMLLALRNDGITADDLSFDPAIFFKLKGLNSSIDDEYITDTAKQLLNEYDVDHKGFLTTKDFHVLSEIIIRNYQNHCDLQANGEHFDLPGYRLKHCIGKGAKGEVRLGVEIDTGIRKAIKIMKKGDVSDLSRIDTEIKAMMMLDHPNIVKLESVHENDTHVFFIMDLCEGGAVSDYMEPGKPLSEDLARFYFKQIVSCASYCHRHGVVHRDLKLDNILMDHNSHIKITDFGHAGIFRKGWDIFATPLVGGISHIAPEQISGRPYPGEKHDVWSLGVILYTFLVGRSPFSDDDPRVFLKNIETGNYQIPDFVSEDGRDLIRSMLVVEPKNRPSTKQIAEHPWLKVESYSKPILTCFEINASSPVVKYIECVIQLIRSLGIEPLEENNSYKCNWAAKDIRFSFSLRRPNENVLIFKQYSGCCLGFLVLKCKIIEYVSRLISRGLKKFNLHSSSGYSIDTKEKQFRPVPIFERLNYEDYKAEFASRRRKENKEHDSCHHPSTVSGNNNSNKEHHKGFDFDCSKDPGKRVVQGKVALEASKDNNYNELLNYKKNIKDKKGEVNSAIVKEHLKKKSNDTHFSHKKARESSRGKEKESKKRRISSRKRKVISAGIERIKNLKIESKRRMPSR